MKKLVYYLSVASLLLAFTGCQKEDPSSLNLESISTQGTVQGVAYYDAGYDTSVVGTNYLPAANKTIYVNVDLSDYSQSGMIPAPGPINGYKTYVVTTDASGKFSLDVPVISGESVYAYLTMNFDGVQKIEDPENPGVQKSLNGVFDYSDDFYIDSNAKQVLNIFVDDFTPIIEQDMVNMLP